MRYRFHTADVFTRNIFGGNPLAVFPDARGLDAARMQRIAGELNLSETVFVFPPEDERHTRRLRIFTPRTELPFAGHPTVGCAHVLVRIGALRLAGEPANLVFEEGVGPVRVSVTGGREAAGSAHLWAPRPLEYGPEPPARETLAEALSLEPAEILETGSDHPRAISGGVPFLFVPVAGREALARARLRRDRWEAHLADFWAPHLYLICREAGAEPQAPLRARMFAPAMGIEEDPATGAAVTALAGYLAPGAERRDGTAAWRVAQGVEMGRPSLLELEIDLRDGDPEAIRVGGTSVLVIEGTMEVPDS